MVKRSVSTAPKLKSKRLVVQGKRIDFALRFGKNPQLPRIAECGPHTTVSPKHEFQAYTDLDLANEKIQELQELVFELQEQLVLILSLVGFTYYPQVAVDMICSFVSIFF
jgi:hypothetical protein